MISPKLIKFSLELRGKIISDSFSQSLQLLFRVHDRYKVEQLKLCLV